MIFFAITEIKFKKIGMLNVYVTIFTTHNSLRKGSCSPPGGEIYR